MARKKIYLAAVLAAAVLVLAYFLAAQRPKDTQSISLAELRDKIAGGWAGQMIGVSYGAPTEFRYLNQIIPEDQLPEWNPQRVRNAIRQDDLYVEMTFAKVLDEKGLDATTEDFGAMFRDSKYALWHANLAAALAHWAHAASQRQDVRHIALAGGVCLNLTLLDALCAQLTAAGLTPLLVIELPPNDGGVSLGQAWVARHLGQ